MEFLALQKRFFNDIVDEWRLDRYCKISIALCSQFCLLHIISISTTTQTQGEYCEAVVKVWDSKPTFPGFNAQCMGIVQIYQSESLIQTLLEDRF